MDNKTNSMESLQSADSKTNSRTRSLGEQFESHNEEIIGEGGFGQVFKAVHKLDGMTYAIKKISFSTTRERDDCFREVKIMAKCNHVNVVSYKNAWIELPEDDDGSSESSEFSSIDGSSMHSIDMKIPKLILCIQMEFCEQNLDTYIDEKNAKKKSFSRYMVNIIGSQILKGLAYLHELNIPHHDIKPSNIFVTKKSKKLFLKIGDFGLSCSSLKPKHRENFGTAIYVSPEQSKNKTCDFKSDIYSVGVVLLKVMHQIKTSAELSEVKEEITQKQFDAPLCLILINKYRDWAKVMVQCLQFEASNRPSAKKILQVVKFRKYIRLVRIDTPGVLTNATNNYNVANAPELVPFRSTENQVQFVPQRYTIFPAKTQIVGKRYQ